MILSISEGEPVMMNEKFHRSLRSWYNRTLTLLRNIYLGRSTSFTSKKVYSRLAVRKSAISKERTTWLWYTLCSIHKLSSSEGCDWKYNSINKLCKLDITKNWSTPTAVINLVKCNSQTCSKRCSYNNRALTYAEMYGCIDFEC